MDTLFQISPIVLVAIPITVGIVQAIKNIGLPDRAAPITSIVIGMGLVALTGAVWQIAVASGIIIGLGASGLYAGSKATIQG